MRSQGFRISPDKNYRLTIPALKQIKVLIKANSFKGLETQEDLIRHQSANRTKIHLLMLRTRKK